MQSSKVTFSPYEKTVVAVLSFLQFTIVLDFMILAPLGAILMPEMKITPAEFSLLVSVYAFSAGISSLLASGFADRFDRKRLLMFFYAGFLLGTLGCALAPTYSTLLFFRMITGVFGGVIASIVYAITGDLFSFETRGRVMGYIQTAFGASQIAGIPVGLFFATHFGWHVPFLLIVGVGIAVGLLITKYLRPIRDHLVRANKESPFMHTIHTIFNRDYAFAFATTAIMATGGYMLNPFSSAFAVHNLGIDLATLPIVYVVTGFATILGGPLIGRMADRIGKVRVFMMGSLVSAVMVIIYTHLPTANLLLFIFVNVLLFLSISSRMISSSALMTEVPDIKSRGAFLSVSASIQQMSGGLSASIAGHIIAEREDGLILHFDEVGYLVVCAIAVTAFMMFKISRKLVRRGVKEPLSLFTEENAV